jgi:hypothetical protein
MGRRRGLRRNPNGDPLGEPTETFVSSSTIQFSSTGGQSHLDLIADGVYAADLDGGRVDKTVQTLSGMGVAAQRGDGDLVSSRLSREWAPQQFSSHRLAGRAISTLLLTASTPQTSTAPHWIPPHSHIIVSHSRLS